MTLYQYQAFDAAGKKKNGVIEAQTEREVKEKLREQGMMVSQIATKKRGSGRENLKGDDLLSFTIQLSQLVGPGFLYMKAWWPSRSNTGKSTFTASS